MSGSVVYNQTVTTDVINEIAKDMGAAEFDVGGTKFGVDALNGITAALVEPGVLLSDEQCRPILSGWTVIISPGTIVFKDGCKMKVSAPVSVELPSLHAATVYARYTKATGRCELVTNLDGAVVGENAICLASVSGGVLYDKRSFSKALVDLPARALGIRWSGKPTEYATEIFTMSETEWNKYSFLLVEGTWESNIVEGFTTDMPAGKWHDCVSLAKVEYEKVTDTDGNTSVAVYIAASTGNSGTVTVSLI